MTAKRFIIDDAGTLIDMSTRNTYDYVSDVVTLLNELSDENEQLKKQIDNMAFILRQNGLGLMEDDD